jgi:predicted dehydrogenase
MVLMLDVGIIGLGQMGRLHLYNCLHIEGVKVVAAADQSKKFLKKAKSLGVRELYTDYHEMLHDPKDLDVVIISLPNSLHRESATLALEAGVNVFVEKPLARTVEECQEISNAVRKSGRKLTVGHCMRFLDSIEQVKKHVDKGLVGSLEVITAEEILNGPFSHGAVPTPVPEWWFNPQNTGGGVLLDLGYHMIDLFRFFGGEADAVFSMLDHKMRLPMEDGAIVVLRSRDSDTKGVINVGWYQKSIFPSFNFRFIVHGNAGFTSTEHFTPKNLYAYAVKEGLKNFSRRIVGRKIKPLSYTYYYEQYVKELATFFDSIRRDVEPPVTVTDGLRTVEIISQAYKLGGLQQESFL